MYKILRLLFWGMFVTSFSFDLGATRRPLSQRKKKEKEPVTATPLVTPADKERASALMKRFIARHMQLKKHEQSLHGTQARRKAKRAVNNAPLKKNIRIRKTARQEEDILYASHPELKVVDLQGGLDLTNKGFPTFKMIKQLVRNHWPSLGQVTIKKGTGGANTGAIYMVFNKDEKLVFFFKVSPIDNQQEQLAWENLAAVQASRVGKLRLRLMKDARMPIITSAEKFFRYYNKDNKPCVIEVTHAARGYDVKRLLKGKTAFSAEQILFIGRMVGVALGLFHKTFMVNRNERNPYDFSDPGLWRTVNHGDFHYENAFFYLPEEAHLDPTWYKLQRPYTPGLAKQFEAVDTKSLLKRDDLSVQGARRMRVYFIDNETIRHSLDKLQKIDWDILEFIFIPLLYCEQFISKSFIASEQHYEQILSFYVSFVNGYISVFPTELQQDLTYYLKSLITEWVNFALICVAQIRAGQSDKIRRAVDKATAPHVQRFTDSEAKSATWLGFIDFIIEHEYEVNSIISRLQKAQSYFENNIQPE